MLGVNISTIYCYLAGDVFKCVVIRGKTFIPKQDIDEMFDKAQPYQMNRTKIYPEPISDVYTFQEIKDKYNVKETWIYKIVCEHKIPKQFLRGKKTHLDKILETPLIK